jgi:hypothetical protein
MVSRNRVGLERWEIRGSPRGSAVLCVCESGAIRPHFFQTTTVKRPQWARPALGLFSECNPGAAAVAGERPQQRSFVGLVPSSRTGIYRMVDYVQHPHRRGRGNCGCARVPTRGI